MQHSDLIDEVVSHCECTGVPYLLIDVRDTPRWQQLSIPIYPVEGNGDVSLTSNDKELCDSFEGWTCNSYPSMAPRSFYDCFDPDFIRRIYKDDAEDQAAMALAATAFLQKCMRCVVCIGNSDIALRRY